MSVLVATEEKIEVEVGARRSGRKRKEAQFQRIVAGEDKKVSGAAVRAVASFCGLG